MLLFHIGQVDRPPAGRVDTGSWVQRLAPAGTAPRIRAVVERYLRLHLDANLDRPQTVRHARDALRRLIEWLAATHPEITNLDQLHREHAEEFLRWLGAQTSQHTGAPLATSPRCRRRTARRGSHRSASTACAAGAHAPATIRPLARYARSHYAAELARTAPDELIAWPPARIAPCWCDSGRKYKQCCGHPIVAATPTVR